MSKGLAELLEKGGRVIEEVTLDDENQHITKMYRIEIENGKKLIISDGLIRKYKPELLRL